MSADLVVYFKWYLNTDKKNFLLLMLGLQCKERKPYCKKKKKKKKYEELQGVI